MGKERIVANFSICSSCSAKKYDFYNKTPICDDTVFYTYSNSDAKRRRPIRCPYNNGEEPVEGGSPELRLRKLFKR